MKILKWIPLLAIPWLSVPQPALGQVCGTPATNLTYQQVRANNRAQISLDGSKITYTYPRQAGVTQNDVWTMNVDGSGKARLYYALSDTDNADTRDTEWSALSADGTKVVFHAWDHFQAAGDQTDIFISDLIAGTVSKITTDPAMDAYPAFSPDGSKVVFLSKRADTAGPYQVFIMKPEPEGIANVPVQLTNAAGFTNTKFARFTPDGKIIFGGVTASTAGAFEVFRMDAVDANSDGVGDNLVRLTNSGGVSASEPSQPTAGGRIFYVGKFSYDGKSHVLSMKADGTDIKQVTGGDFDESYAFAAGSTLIASYTDPANGVGNTDIEAYSLVDSTSSGTVSGTITGAAGALIANATVKVYTLKTLVTTVTTNASGVYTATLPAGGYSLEIIPPASPAYATALRGVTVTPGGATVKDVVMSPTGAPRPASLMATYRMDWNTMAPSADPVTYAFSGVSLTWAAGAVPSAGWTVSGYNVYFATSENGPWTKISDTPVAPVVPLLFDAPVPADPAAAFYAVTAVSANGASTLESAPSEVAQAANNVLLNGDFDSGTEDWDRDPSWWSGSDWQTQPDATDKVGSTGASLYNLAGASPGSVSIYSQYTATTPVVPGAAYVASMYAHMTDNPGTGLVTAGLQHSTATPTAMWWDDTSYPAEYQLPKLAGGGPSVPNVPWTYLPNTGALRVWEDVNHTRFAANWDATGATAGLSRVYFDDARLQVRRVGATGTIYGRIMQSGAGSVAGVLVSAAGKSTRTDSVRGQFVLNDIPTGMVELTFTLPDYDAETNTPAGHQYKVTVPNYGGFAFTRQNGGILRDTIIWEALPRTLIAFVKDEAGNPIENANVRFVNWQGAAEVSGITDAKGQFSILQPSDFPYNPDDWWTDVGHMSMAMANAPGYLGVHTAPFFAMATYFYGWDVADFTLKPSTIIEAAKTTTAPTIDGDVTTTEWNTTQKVSVPFVYGTDTVPQTDAWGNPVVPKEKTWAYAKWDDNNLYLALASEEPNPAGMIALSTGHDDFAHAMWAGDDEFTLWLDTTNFAGVGLGHEYWQLMTNSNVTPSWTDIMWRQTWDNGSSPFVWNADEAISGLEFKSKVDSTAKMYYTEMKIPYAGLASTTIAGGVPAPIVADGSEWAVRLQRVRSQSVPSGEITDSYFVVLRFVSSLTSPVKGDLNGDRVVNSEDALSSLRIAAGLEALGGRIAQADVNGDTKANLSDTVMIIRKINGKGGF